MTTYKTLIEALKKEPQFVDEFGQLKRQVIVDQIKRNDPSIIRRLRQNPDLRQAFFESVDDALVFKSEALIELLRYKNYQEDSYTKYKNKIGLGRQRPASDRGEVVVNWPHKDCLLVGGQSKQEVGENKRELFLNQILAADQITQLLEPKALTDPRLLDKQTGDWITPPRNDLESGRLFDNNLLIKANNLIALASISARFRDQIKLIYIDPPYNSGGNTETFTYNNSFRHSTWLTFMKNRLELARPLLRPDGLIAIAIDHHELAYLTVLADEVFGRDNRLAIITVVSNPSGRQWVKFFNPTTEFMLIYAKDRESADLRQVTIANHKDHKKRHQDVRGEYKPINFRRESKTKASDPRCWYRFYVSPDLETVSLNPQPGWTEVWPINKSGGEKAWISQPKEAEKKIAENEIVAQMEDDRIEIYHKHRRVSYSTHWDAKEYNASTYGTTHLAKQTGKKGNVSFPKSVHLVSDVVKIMTTDDDIILDFFAGSGTTGEAVWRQNGADGGRRRFILVEQLKEHLGDCRLRLGKTAAEIQSDQSILYFELKMSNQKFKDQIRAAQTTDQIWKVALEIIETAHINYNVKTEVLKNDPDGFRRLKTEEQKLILENLLDQNQLYVNKSSLEDADFDIAAIEKQITNSFYQNPDASYK